MFKYVEEELKKIVCTAYVLNWDYIALLSAIINIINARKPRQLLTFIHKAYYAPLLI